MTVHDQITLTPGQVPLEDWRRIYEGAARGSTHLLPRKGRGRRGGGREDRRKGRSGLRHQHRLRKARQRAHRGGDVETLQRNLILSHCCGVGDPLDPAIVRLVMALKLGSLGRGASGVRLEDREAHRGDAWSTASFPSSPAGLGRRLGRSRAAGAHGGRHDGRRRRLRGGERLPAADALARTGLKPVVLAARRAWR